MTIIEAKIKKIKWQKSTKTSFICDVCSSDTKTFTVLFFCRKLDGEKIEINRDCRFIGSWVNHPKFGRQFEAKEIEIIPYPSVKSKSSSNYANNFKKKKKKLPEPKNNYKKNEETSFDKAIKYNVNDRDAWRRMSGRNRYNTR